MKKIRKYFKGVAEEAHRVRWPSAKELWPAVGVVIGVTVICAFQPFLTTLLWKFLELSKESIQTPAQHQAQVLKQLPMLF